MQIVGRAPFRFWLRRLLRDDLSHLLLNPKSRNYEQYTTMIHVKRAALVETE